MKRILVRFHDSKRVNKLHRFVCIVTVSLLLAARISGNMYIEHLKKEEERGHGGNSYESESLNLRFTAPRGVYLATERELVDMSRGSDVSHVMHMFAYTPDNSVTVVIFTDVSVLGEMSAEEYLLNIGCDTVEPQPLSFANNDYTLGYMPAKSDAAIFEVLCRKAGDAFLSIYILYDESFDVGKVYDAFSSFG